LYNLAREAVDPTNLLYLQGCIVVAFYWYKFGPCARGWVLSGVRIRLAYDLDLTVVDEDDSETLNTEDWVRRQEMRRAFWLVCELDTFGSTISMRPYAIDRSRMAVLLPVFDKAWLVETPVSLARCYGLPRQGVRSGSSVLVLCVDIDALERSLGLGKVFRKAWVQQSGRSDMGSFLISLPKEVRLFVSSCCDYASALA
jgi:hypothetical protein